VSPRRASLPAAPRLNWLRRLALALGGLVFIAHVFTVKLNAWSPPFWDIDWIDIAKHFGMMSAFALAYRLSWRYPAGGGSSRSQPSRAQQRGPTRRAADARRRAARGREPVGLPGGAGDALVRTRQWLELWDVPGAGLRTVLLCSGWGAFCEVLQLWHPYRDASPYEFAINVLTPALWCGVVWVVTHRRA
jgi:hypothetical protein